MKKLIFTLLACYAMSAHAQTNHLVISQVYAAGGNAGAFYTHDFVELYNPTGSDISLSGWSLQYAGATSSTWSSSNQVNLSGTIKAGKYFLIQLDGGANGKPLPQPDIIVTNVNVNLGAAGGKVALVNSTAPLPNGCPASTFYVDLVGYKSNNPTPNCSETTPIVASATNYIGSFSRKANGCTDTDNNSNDFETTTPSPRNSSSAAHTCNAGSLTITSVTSNPFCVDSDNGVSGTVSYAASGSFANSSFKAVISDGKGSFGSPVTIGTAPGSSLGGTIPITIPAKTPSDTGYRIRIEATSPSFVSGQSAAFEVINGAKNLLPNQFKSAADENTVKLNWTNPTGCFDEIMIVAKVGDTIMGTPIGDGSAYTADLNFKGNGTAFDGGKVVYKGTVSGQTVTNLDSGTTYSFRAYTRRGTIWSSGTEISDRPRRVPRPGEIVINQLSPDYGDATDEYIELVNLTNIPFELSDVIIDITDRFGNRAVARNPLSGIISAHGYWLVSYSGKNTITVGKTNALAADTTINLRYSNDNQVGLIRSTDSVVLDGIAYGTISTPVYREGAPLTTNPPPDGGLKRKISGADNNNNSTDFERVDNANIELRNSKSRLANAGAVIVGGNYMTLDVTGNATLSGNITLSDKIAMTAGIFSLNDHNLSAAKATSGTSAKYIKTNGTGAFTITNVTSEAFFPVGNSTFNPVTISNGSGLNWSVHVLDAIAPDPTPFDEAAAVQRTWNVTPSGTPITGATVVFEYNDNDPSQIGNRFNTQKEVQVWNYHTGLWKPVTIPQMPTTAPEGRKAATLSNYILFSPFAVVNEDALLPIRFVRFSARAEAKGIQLQFTNLSERDVAHYVIERSANGQDFSPLTQLSPQNRGGEATHRWLDAAPPAGNIWYRVKGLETDGTITYTNKLQIDRTEKAGSLTVYPSPARGRSLVWKATLPQGTYQLQVSSSNGQQVLLQTIEHGGGNRTQTLDLPAGMQPGVYRLQIGSSALLQQQTFVVL